MRVRDRSSGRSCACDDSREIDLARGTASFVRGEAVAGGPARRKSTRSRLAEYPSSSRLVTVADLAMWRVCPEKDRSRCPPWSRRPIAASAAGAGLVVLPVEARSSLPTGAAESPGPLERKKSANSIATDCPPDPVDVAAARGSGRGRGLAMRGVCERSVVHRDSPVEVVDVLR